MSEKVRLTSLASGGGCGGILSPAALAEIMALAPPGPAGADLLCGGERPDDAAVWRIGDGQAVASATAAFTPMVDDPGDFGRIAAAHALSNIYAVGARPVMATAFIGVPSMMGADAVGRILAGGAQSCAAAGVPVAGGHTFTCAEPVYGLSVVGVLRPDRVLATRQGQEGDILILTKPLGLGVLGEAHRSERIDAAAYETLMTTATQANDLGSLLADTPGVHAVTDIGGGGLTGHALQMALGARLIAEISSESVPCLPGVDRLLRAGLSTATSRRNWESHGELVQDLAHAARWRRELFSDPQIGGGLLIAVTSDQAAGLTAAIRAKGFNHAGPVGRLVGRSMGILPRVRLV